MNTLGAPVPAVKLNVGVALGSKVTGVEALLNVDALKLKPLEPDVEVCKEISVKCYISVTKICNILKNIIK